MKNELEKRIKELEHKLVSTDWLVLPLIDKKAIQGMLERLSRLYDDLYGEIT